MTELQISPGNPWAPPAREAVTVPFVCRPETSATTGRVLCLLGAGAWGAFAVAQPFAHRAQFDWTGEVLWILLAIGSLAAAWAWPRLVRTTTITAEGLVHERHRVTTQETLPWSAVESITPGPGGADTVAVRFSGAPLVQVQGRQSDRRIAIEAIYAFALPTLTLRMVARVAAGELVHLAPWAGRVFGPGRSSPRGLFVNRDGLRLVGRWRQTLLAWRDIESIEWRGFGRAVLHARASSLTIDGRFENASALLAAIPELVARHRSVRFEGARPPTTRFYAGLYAVALGFGALLLVVVVGIYAPSGRLVHFLGLVLRRTIDGDRDLVEAVAICLGSMLPMPLVVHVVLAWTHWRERRRGPRPTSLWTGPGMDAPQP